MVSKIAVAMLGRTGLFRNDNVPAFSAIVADSFAARNGPDGALRRFWKRTTGELLDKMRCNCIGTIIVIIKTNYL